VKTSLPVFPARSGSIREIFSSVNRIRIHARRRHANPPLHRADADSILDRYPGFIRGSLGGFRFVSAMNRTDVKESRPVDTLSAGRQQRGASVRFINIVIGAQKSVRHTQGSYVLPSVAESPSPPLSTPVRLFSGAVVRHRAPAISHVPFSTLHVARSTFFSLSAPFPAAPSRPVLAAPSLFFLPARRTVPRCSLVPLFFAPWRSFVAARRTCSHSSGTDRTKKGA